MENLDLFEATPENHNGLKLYWLVVTGGTLALHEQLNVVLRQRDVINHELTVGYCENLEIRLNNHQREKIESGEWDLNLLFHLLKGLCYEESPDGGWHRFPDSTDQSVVADITRISCYRNLVFHRPSICLSQREFEEFWKDLSEAIIRLGVSRADIEELHSRDFHVTQACNGEEKGELRASLEYYKKFVEDSKEQLKDWFYEYHPTTGNVAFSDHLKKYRSVFENLMEQGHLSTAQWEALFPPNGEKEALETFSFSLWYKLVMYTSEPDQDKQEVMAGFFKKRREMLTFCRDNPMLHHDELVKFLAEELLLPNKETSVAGHCYRKGQKLIKIEDRENEFQDLRCEKRKKLPWKIMDHAKTFICGVLNTGGKGMICFGVTDEGEVVGLQLQNHDKDNIGKAYQATLDDHIRRNECPMSSGGDQSCVNLDFVQVLASDTQDLYVVHVSVEHKWEFCEEYVYYDRMWREEGGSAVTSTEEGDAGNLHDFYTVDEKYEHAATRQRGATKRHQPHREWNQIRNPLQIRHQKWQQMRDTAGQDGVAHGFVQNDGVPSGVDVDGNVVSRTQEGANIGKESGLRIRSGSPTPNELQSLAAKVLDVWEKLGRALQLSDSVITEIKHDEKRIYEQSYAVLVRWKETKASSATYEALAKGLCHQNVGFDGLAEWICYTSGAKVTPEMKPALQSEPNKKAKEETKEGQTKSGVFVSGVKGTVVVHPGNLCLNIPLSVSQNTALDNSLDGSIPSNDGTNSCSFLCTLIAHNFLTHEEFATATGEIWKRFATMAEGIIRDGPLQFNNLREKSQHYDASEAYKELRMHNIIDAEYEFTEEFVEGHSALSSDGKGQLLVALNRIIEQSRIHPCIAMYTCHGVIFLIGCTGLQQLFILDTHPIPTNLGGTGSGLLMVMQPRNPYQSNYLSQWIAERLAMIGVSNDSQEKHSLAVMSCSENRQGRGGEEAEANQGVARENSFYEQNATILEEQDSSYLGQLEAVAVTQLHFLAEGGQGRVYKASLKNLNGEFTDVAVKKINRKGKAFKREEKVKNLRNTHIVPVWNLFSDLRFKDSDGPSNVAVYPYMVNGNLYKKLFDRQPNDREPLHWRTRIKIAAQILSGLCYLHANNFILRDVKSSNVLLDKNNNVRICDYGLVKEFGSDVINISSGPVTGYEMTRGYTCPDYKTRHDDEGSSMVVKPAHDQYGFGIVILELLTELPAIRAKDNTSLPCRLNIIKFVKNGCFSDGSSVSESVDAILKDKDAAVNMNRIEWPDDVKKKLAKLAVGCLFHISDNRIPLECLHEKLKKLVMTYPEKGVACEKTKQCNNCLKLRSHDGNDTLPCLKCSKLLTLYQDSADDRCLFCCRGKRETELQCCECKLVCRDCTDKCQSLRCPYHVDKIRVNAKYTRLICVAGAPKPGLDNLANSFEKDVLAVAETFQSSVGLQASDVVRVIPKSGTNPLGCIESALKKFKKDFERCKKQKEKSTLVALVSGHFSDGGKFLASSSGRTPCLFTGNEFRRKLNEVGADITIVIVSGSPSAQCFVENYKDKVDVPFPAQEVPAAQNRADCFTRTMITWWCCSTESEVQNRVFLKLLVNGLKGAEKCFQVSPNENDEPVVEEVQGPCEKCKDLRNVAAYQGEFDLYDVMDYVAQHIRLDQEKFKANAVLAVPKFAITGDGSRILLPRVKPN